MHVRVILSLVAGLLAVFGLGACHFDDGWPHHHHGHGYHYGGHHDWHRGGRHHGHDGAHRRGYRGHGWH